MTEVSKAYWSGGRSFDMRHVPGPVYLAVEGERVPHQAVWVKPFDSLRPVDGLTDAQRDLAALAYVCDYTILEPVLRVRERDDLACAQRERVLELPRHRFVVLEEEDLEAHAEHLSYPRGAHQRQQMVRL